MQKEKITKTNNKGITLIALIITIIVMLILVAVTVNVAMNGGLFGTTNEAAMQTQIEADREELQAGIAGAYNAIEGTIDKTKLQNNLSSWTVEEEGPFKCTSPNGNVFIVDMQGKILDSQTEADKAELQTAIEGLTEINLETLQNTLSDWTVYQSGENVFTCISKNESEFIVTEDKQIIDATLLYGTFYLNGNENDWAYIIEKGDEGKVNVSLVESPLRECEMSLNSEKNTINITGGSGLESNFEEIAEMKYFVTNENGAIIILGVGVFTTGDPNKIEFNLDGKFESENGHYLQFNKGSSEFSGSTSVFGEGNYLEIGGEYVCAQNGDGNAYGTFTLNEDGTTITMDGIEYINTNATVPEKNNLTLSDTQEIIYDKYKRVAEKCEFSYFLNVEKDKIYGYATNYPNEGFLSNGQDIQICIDDKYTYSFKEDNIILTNEEYGELYALSKNGLSNSKIVGKYEDGNGNYFNFFNNGEVCQAYDNELSTFSYAIVGNKLYMNWDIVTLSDDFNSFYYDKGTFTKVN